MAAAVHGAPQPHEYPAELECDLATRNGGTVHLRPIRPSDGPRLVDFHSRLSARSVYLRYFTAHPTLSPTEVERFATVDYWDRLALVAEEGGGIIAVGRYDRIDDGKEAEVAFIVADESQQLGIGTILLEQLAIAARKRGIDTFVAETLYENRRMLDVFMHSGFEVHTTTDHGVVELRFSIC